MRLESDEIGAIKQTFLNVFRQGNIYLFGSRTDDSLKGGDIDLYVIPSETLDRSEVLEKKIDFLVEVKNLIGDQKIDLVISRDRNRPIEQEAVRTGIRL